MISKGKIRRHVVCRVAELVNFRYKSKYGFQNGIASERIERIGKIQLSHHVTRGHSLEATKRLVACTAASQPPGTPTPTCRGANKFSNLVSANVLAYYYYYYYYYYIIIIIIIIIIILYILYIYIYILYIYILYIITYNQWRSHGGREGALAPPTPPGTTHEIHANPKTFFWGG